MKLFNHNQLNKQKEACKHLEPLIASDDGYILTQDERIAYRFALGKSPVNLWRNEVKTLGLDHPGITPQEAYHLQSRISQLPDIEDAALKLQLFAARMRILLRKVHDLNCEEISPKLKVDIARILLDTEPYV